MEAANGGETDSMSRAEPLEKTFYYRHRQKKNMYRSIHPERALEDLREATQRAGLSCTTTEWAGM